MIVSSQAPGWIGPAEARPDAVGRLPYPHHGGGLRSSRVVTPRDHLTRGANRSGQRCSPRLFLRFDGYGRLVDWRRNQLGTFAAVSRRRIVWLRPPASSDAAVYVRRPHRWLIGIVDTGQPYRVVQRQRCCVRGSGWCQARVEAARQFRGHVVVHWPQGGDDAPVARPAGTQTQD